MIYFRNCPKCNKKIFYIHKISFDKSKRKNTLCKVCRSKSPYDIWVEKYGIDEANKRKLEYGNKISKAISGSNNPMYGKSLLDTWIEKYGLEEADRLNKQHSKRLSEALIDENGNLKRNIGGGGAKYFGWGGWYNNINFRSLLELSYIISLEKENLKWESAENINFRIKYFNSLRNKEQYYYPDFFVENKYLIEIKPIRFQKYQTILDKKEAAEKWCLERGYEYKFIDIKILTKEIIDLYLDKKIIWNKSTIPKFEKFYRKEIYENK